MINKYLICVGKTDYARNAIRYTALKAQKHSAIVEILHVINPNDYVDLFSFDNAMETNKQIIYKQLREIVQEIELEADIKIQIDIQSGNFKEQVIEKIKSNTDINLCVLETPTYSGLTIESLLHEMNSSLKIPIFILPSNMTNTEIEELI